MVIIKEIKKVYININKDDLEKIKNLLKPFNNKINVALNKLLQDFLKE